MCGTKRSLRGLLGKKYCWTTRYQYHLRRQHTSNGVRFVRIVDHRRRWGSHLCLNLAWYRGMLGDQYGWSLRVRGPYHKIFTNQCDVSERCFCLSFERSFVRFAIRYDGEMLGGKFVWATGRWNLKRPVIPNGCTGRRERRIDWSRCLSHMCDPFVGSREVLGMEHLRSTWLW